MTDERLQECRAVKRLFLIEKNRAGMTHKTLAKMINKSPKLVSAIVNEHTGVTVDVGRRLAKVFAVPLTEILPWTAALSESESRSNYSGVIDDLEELSPENRLIALRMIRNLLDSQEES